MNSVALVGRLTRDVELRYTPNGYAVASFGLAVDRQYKDDEADFIDVTCWQGTARAVANNLGKGRLVAVRGELRQDRWQTDEGQNRSKVKVNAQEVKFLDWPGDERKTMSEPNLDISEDDAPF